MENLSPVDDKEILARFIRYKRHIRANGTVKQDAFIPHPHCDLSVIRHIGLKEEELWVIGRSIIISLQGRADISAKDVKKQHLRINPTAKPYNHANISGWPPEKESQKIIALELAANARFVPR